MVRQAMPSAWPTSNAARLLLDDAGLDIRELRKLGGEREAGRPAADDKDIDLFGHGPRCARGLNALGGVGDLGIARLKSIQMELHEHSPRNILFGYCSVC